MRTVELETGVEALAFGFSQDVREAVSDVEGYLQKCKEAERYEVTLLEQSHYADQD